MIRVSNYQDGPIWQETINKYCPCWKGWSRLLSRVEYVLFYSATHPKNIFGGGFIDKGNIIDNILGYVSGWYRMYPREKNISVE